MNSHWQTLTQIKDDEYDLSHPEFDTLNGDKLPECEPKSTLFPKFAKDSDEPEGVFLCLCNYMCISCLTFCASFDLTLGY